MSEERIVNGGFEDGDVGWDAVLSEDCLFMVWPIYVHSGEWSCVIVSFIGSPLLTQKVDFTNVNTLSFWYDHYGMGFFVGIDETLIDYYDPTGDWTYVTIDVSEYSGIHTLTFGLVFGDEEGGIFVFLDDISAIAEPKYWYETNFEPKGYIGQRHKGVKVGGKKNAVR